MGSCRALVSVNTTLYNACRKLARAPEAVHAICQAQRHGERYKGPTGNGWRSITPDLPSAEWLLPTRRCGATGARTQWPEMRDMCALRAQLRLAGRRLTTLSECAGWVTLCGEVVNGGRTTVVVGVLFDAACGVAQLSRHTLSPTLARKALRRAALRPAVQCAASCGLHFHVSCCPALQPPPWFLPTTTLVLALNPLAATVLSCAMDFAMSGITSKISTIEPSTKWKNKVREECRKRPDRTIARGMCPVGRNPKLDEVRRSALGSHL